MTALGASSQSPDLPPNAITADKLSSNTTPTWEERIAAARLSPELPVTAVQFVESLPSASRPQKFVCDDGCLYAVKFRNNLHGDGRAIFTEQVVARIGGAIGAAVPKVKVAIVEASLLGTLSIDLGAGPGVGPEPGMHHASLWQDGFTDKAEFIRYPDKNRAAFAGLQLLFSLFQAGDHQLVYRNAEPNDPLSVDHTCFLPGGPNWTTVSLAQAKDTMELDHAFDQLNLTAEDFALVQKGLADLSDDAIAAAVAASPDDWGVPMADRVAVAEYIAQRRDLLLTKVGGST
jgi:hypothetical protein